MEVLSGVSSGFAVVSLALQLAEKVTKIHDFWRSVRDAPDELGSIAAELKFLERVYIGIAHNAQRETIDPILTKALEDGQQEVTRFEALVSPLRKRCETENNLRRKWASLVAGVWRKEEVAEFYDSISRTKSTLLIALQASARNRLLSDSVSQTRMLATLADNSTSLRTGQKDIEVAIGDLSQKTGFLSLELTSHFSLLSSQSSDIKYIKEQLAGMESLIARMARSFPEAVRVQLVDDMNHEVQELSKDGLFSRNARSADSLALSGVNRSDSNTLEAITQSEVDPREKTSSNAYRALSRHHCRKTVFGTFNIRLRMSAMYQSANPQADRTSYTISFYPAHWLIWCGVRYGIELSVLQSVSGWTRRLEPLRMVSRDAVVFELCRDGNIGAVRTLIAKGEASARDTAPRGFTPLIMAAYYGRFELCEYLISAGAETYVNSARPVSLPLIYYLIGVSYLRKCIDLKFFRLFDDHLEGILEINFHIDFFVGTLFHYSLKRTTTFAVSDPFCDSLCEVLRQYRVTFRQILQYSDDSMRQCILHFSARCSFGAFQDILSLDETLIEPMSDKSSILHFLAESEWDELELTARLLFLRNRGVDLLSASEKYHAPLLRAVCNPNWLRTWVASLRNCGKSFQEIVTAQLSTSTFLLSQEGWESETLHHLLNVCRGLPFIGTHSRLCKLCRCVLAKGYLDNQPWWVGIGAGLLARKCICRSLSLAGSRYRYLCPSKEHKCDFGSNNILRDAVDVEHLSMEGGAEADDEEQDTNHEDWETEYEDGQSEEDECEWKPGEWICWTCDRRSRVSESEVTEDIELKIPGSFVD